MTTEGLQRTGDFVDPAKSRNLPKWFSAGSWCAALLQAMPDDGEWRLRREVMEAVREIRPDKQWGPQAALSPRSGSAPARRLAEAIRELAQAGLIEREGREGLQQIRWTPGVIGRLPLENPRKKRRTGEEIGDETWTWCVAVVVGSDGRWRLVSDVVRVSILLAASHRQSTELASLEIVRQRVMSVVDQMEAAGVLESQGPEGMRLVRLSNVDSFGTAVARNGCSPRRIPPPPLKSWRAPMFDEARKGWYEFPPLAETLTAE